MTYYLRQRLDGGGTHNNNRELIMWQGKRKGKVADESTATTAMKLEIKSAASAGRSRRKASPSKKNAADKQLRKFFNTIGKNMEAFIDASPLGVPDPEPWDERTDKKKALLNNPAISILHTVSETIDNLSPTRMFNSLGAKSAGCMWGMTLMLMSLREGLANACIVEEKMEGGGGGEDNVDSPAVLVEVEVDVKVDSEGEAGEAYVDLGADRWGNSPRTSNTVKETVSEVRMLKKAISHFLRERALPFIDNLTLRANGIVVTSDDCSVECSLASLIDEQDDFEACSPTPSIYTESGTESEEDDDDDFEECPSVVTDIGVEEQLQDDDEEGIKEEREGPVEIIKTEDQVVSSQEEDEEYVIMVEEPDSDEEDFIDVRAEFDM